jgi:hypothetical protein
MSNELWRRSARDLARMIAAREVSSREVVEAHIARIEAVNPKINAVVFRLDEAALAAADVADASPPGGPLHGVPFTIKENIDCTGSATTQGMPAFEQVVPSLDAPPTDTAATRLVRPSQRRRSGPPALADVARGGAGDADQADDPLDSRPRCRRSSASPDGGAA